MSKSRIKNVKKLESKYRSKLEEFCAKQLELSKIEFEYESSTVIIQDSFLFENDCYEKKRKKDTSTGKYKTYLKNIEKEKIRKVTYTPDFIDPNNKWLIEVKGFQTPEFKIKWKMYKKYLHDNNIKIDIYMPGNQEQVLEVINLIKEKYG